MSPPSSSSWASVMIDGSVAEAWMPPVSAAAFWRPNTRA
eukprot:CAMPEP_0179878386 /NCGR_PEP_ID=MMETSP0982-20121206/25351_1 /TAXON_ID=483367 /ORGANISM="non described non described, Strain CCMP 2436" /LENGTH=38 /DNA_ID= /DNA_START= /DNA_END= /DNA_ORIENTATION=